LNPWSSQLL